MFLYCNCCLEYNFKNPMGMLPFPIFSNIFGISSAPLIGTTKNATTALRVSPSSLTGLESLAASEQLMPAFRFAEKPLSKYPSLPHFSPDRLACC